MLEYLGVQVGEEYTLARGDILGRDALGRDTLALGRTDGLGRSESLMRGRLGELGGAAGELVGSGGLGGMGRSAGGLRNW